MTRDKSGRSPPKRPPKSPYTCHRDTIFRLQILRSIKHQANFLEHTMDFVETVLVYDRIHLLASLLYSSGLRCNQILNEGAVQLITAAIMHCAFF